MSAAAFCRRHGMSTVSLANWRRRYIGGEAAAIDGSTPASPRSPQWLPVMLSSAGPHSPAPCTGGYVLAGQDCRLEVPRAFDAAEVRELWHILLLNTEGRS